MEYHTNIKALCESKLRNPKTALELHNRAKKAEQWAAKSCHDLSSYSRDMQMVPIYLELAEYKGKCRFNSTEIAELTGSVKMYKSEIPVTELVKQLLNIGIEHGEPLSVKEMKDFLAATALMDKNEQISIIKFITSLKENTSVNSNKDCTCKVSEKSDLIPYKAYTSKYYTEPGSISKFISLNNLQFVYGITRCQKPEILAKIAQVMGPTREVAIIPNDLVQAYELSNGNMDLVQDLLRGFYPWEADEIVSKLSTQNSSADLSKYKSLTSAADYVNVSISSFGIEHTREIILERLGLKDQIKLSEVDYPISVKVIDGSYEQGKRR